MLIPLQEHVFKGIFDAFSSQQTEKSRAAVGNTRALRPVFRTAASLPVLDVVHHRVCVVLHRPG